MPAQERKPVTISHGGDPDDDRSSKRAQHRRRNRPRRRAENARAAQMALFVVSDVYQPPLAIHDGRKTCRTISDAIECLNADRVIVGIMQVPLPNGQDAGMVMVRPSPVDREKPRLVRMPDANFFVAYTLDGKKLELPIARLNDVEVASDGTAKLSCGMAIKAIELIKGTRLPTDLNADGRKVVATAVEILGEGTQRMGLLHHGSLRTWYQVDYERLPTIEIQHLKKLVADVKARLPDLAHAKIERALRFAGFRIRPAVRRRIA